MVEYNTIGTQERAIKLYYYLLYFASSKDLVINIYIISAIEMSRITSRMHLWQIFVRKVHFTKARKIYLYYIWKEIRYRVLKGFAANHLLGDWRLARSLCLLLRC